MSQPDAATVVLDGRPVGVTPWTGETWPGRHRIRLRSDGYQDAERIVELERYRADDVAFVLVPALRTGARPSSPESGEQSPRRSMAGDRIGPMTWAMLAAGVASFAAALVYQAQSDGGGPGMARTTAFLAGAGTAATVAGGIMLCFDLTSSRGRRIGVSMGMPVPAWAPY